MTAPLISLGIYSLVCSVMFLLQALRRYRNRDFDEELRPSAPVGFCFLKDDVVLHIPFDEAELQGYIIRSDTTPCKVKTQGIVLLTTVYALSHGQVGKNINDSFLDVKIRAEKFGLFA